MMAVLYLLVFGFYSYIVFIFARAGFRFVCDRGKGRLWGGAFATFIGLVGFGAVFWDAIPTWYTHHHLCKTEGGLKVYITPEQWAKENPEAFARVRAAAGGQQTRRSEDTRETWHSWVETTQDFTYEYFDRRARDYAFHTGISRQKMIYKPTGQVLFEEVDFYSSAGKNSLAGGANSFADYKFWTVTGGCERAYPDMKNKFQHKGLTFSDLAKQIYDWNQK